MASTLFRIFKILHKPTGMYALSITKARDYSLMAFVERVNDMARWKPTRKLNNYALKYFANMNYPLKTSDFEISVVPGSEHNCKEMVAGLAGMYAEANGTDKLLTTQIVNNADWKLHHIAIDYLANVKTFHAEGCEQVKPPLPIEMLEITSTHANADVSMFSRQHDTHLTLTQTLIETHEYQRVVLMTKDPTEALLACNKAKRNTVVLIEVNLLTQRAPRNRECFVTHTFAHFGPYIEKTLAEATTMADELIRQHRENTVYSFYKL